MARRAFTLIELLLVLTILGLLMIVLMPKFAETLNLGKVRQTQALAQQIAMLADSFETETGAYPSSDYEGIAARPLNDVNTGAESLVAHLASPEVAGRKPEETLLVNTDADRFPRRVTSFAVDDAFELKDAWGNPFAYFDAKGYGRSQTYRTIGGGGEEEDSDVQPVRSRKTGDFLRPESFQVISAGKDGVYGTKDDVVHGADS